MLCSFFLSPEVSIPDTSWTEPVLVWIAVSMSSGSRKTTIYNFLSKIVKDVKEKIGVDGKAILFAFMTWCMIIALLCIHGFV